MGLEDWFRALENAHSMPTYILRPEPDFPLSTFVMDRRDFRREERTGRGPRRPRLHPTKGYRGAHKLFRGGSR